MMKKIGVQLLCYAAYTSVDNSADYLFLREMGSMDIVSIADPLNPVSVGVWGVREPGVLTLALRLEAAELLDIRTEEGISGKSALFGIPSLDALNRKYGYPVGGYYGSTSIIEITTIEVQQEPDAMLYQETDGYAGYGYGMAPDTTPPEEVTDLFVTDTALPQEPTKEHTSLPVLWNYSNMSYWDTISAQSTTILENNLSSWHW
ncbi:MAG: hypothetical protein ACMUJM_05435 [bacterium]